MRNCSSCNFLLQIHIQSKFTTFIDWALEQILFKLLLFVNSQFPIRTTNQQSQTGICKTNLFR